MVIQDLANRKNNLGLNRMFVLLEKEVIFLLGTLSHELHRAASYQTQFLQGHGIKFGFASTR